MSHRIFHCIKPCGNKENTIRWWHMAPCVGVYMQGMLTCGHNYTTHILTRGFDHWIRIHHIKLVVTYNLTTTLTGGQIDFGYKLTSWVVIAMAIRMTASQNDACSIRLVQNDNLVKLKNVTIRFYLTRFLNHVNLEFL